MGVYLTNTVMLYSSQLRHARFNHCLPGIRLIGKRPCHWWGGRHQLGQESNGHLGIISIIVSGIAGFLIQRVFRGVVRDQCEDPKTISLHGPWMAGALMTGLVYFMLMKA